MTKLTQSQVQSCDKPTLHWQTHCVTLGDTGAQATGISKTTDKVKLSGCGCIVVVEWAFNHTHFAFILEIKLTRLKSFNRQFHP